MAEDPKTSAPETGEQPAQPAPAAAPAEPTPVRRQPTQADEIAAASATDLARLHEDERNREGGPRTATINRIARANAQRDTDLEDQAIGYMANEPEVAAAHFNVATGLARQAFAWTGRRRLTEDEFAEALDAVKSREV